jgi:DNA-binding transcriptional ArsR family regulator
MMSADIVAYLREPERAKDVLARLYRAWFEQAWTDRWPVIEPVLRRSAGIARELIGTNPVPELFERLTNGIQYRLEPGIDRVIFVPSYVQAPRAFWARCDRDFVVGFPVPGEALTDDPEEGRRCRALKVTRALADDTRLRALRLLAEQPCSLQELADAVGVRKSTMHHHIAVLRGAGLLLITMHDKRYQLRWAAIGEANVALSDYLGAGNHRRRKRS